MGSAAEETAGSRRPEFFNEYWRRSSLCGRVGEESIGAEIRVNGWVRRRRDLGGIVFVELWDWTGSVQVVFSPDT
ncbi:MAG: Asp-tRNA(Asn)/Glu-tRNA(Gln) amidotransferase GatCAB subunit C, partial [Synergistaceae bacterium]|nr:Asp-tRNA(Asn)/Glu-tRNA(Gln) amidotransferase GatCAB subunit C [Synergistaceae bacterium]